MTPTSPNPTWYDVLGVSRDAIPAEIKAAWRNATDKFEPGSGSGQFRMFNEAADVLLDPERRAAYDASLDAETPVQPGVSRWRRTRHRRRRRRWSTSRVDEPTPTARKTRDGRPRRSDAGSVPSVVPGSRRQRRPPPPSRRPAEPGSWPLCWRC